MTQVLQQGNNNANPITITPRRESRLVDFPEFKEANQDPIEWLESFDRACKANSVSMNRRMDIVASYLKGTALTWFNRSGATQWKIFLIQHNLLFICFVTNSVTHSKFLNGKISLGIESRGLEKQ